MRDARGSDDVVAGIPPGHVLVTIAPTKGQAGTVVCSACGPVVRVPKFGLARRAAKIHGRLHHPGMDVRVQSAPTGTA